MPCAAAGKKVKAVHLAQIHGGDVQAAELGRAAIFGKTAAHAVFECGRLFEDLLLHEMLMPVQLRVGDIPSNLVDDRGDILRVQRADGKILGGDVNELPVLEVDDVLRAADDG